jgi:hypothetical protein
MLWRYEQPFYGKQLVPGDGWGSGFSAHEGSTGLIRVNINPSPSSSSFGKGGGESDARM